MKKIFFPIIAAFFCVISSCKPDFPGGEGPGSGINITSITPLEGEPGTHITIKGTGFNVNKAKDLVFFNTVKGTVVSATTNSIEVIVPETNTSTAAIRLAVNSIPSQNSYTFHFFDLYVTGRVYNASGKSFARLWKNSVVQSYPDNSFSTALRLFNNGNDIYFGTNSGYFKNNTYVKLNSNSTYQGLINSVIVNNGNVIAGGPGGYYKNGTFIELPHYDAVSGYPEVEDIIAVKDTLYFAAYDPKGSTGILYKNGVPVPEEHGDRHALPLVVAARGQEIHVGGLNVELNPYATEWVNGKSHGVSPYDYVNDILFHGNDEYQAVSGSNFQTLYLKNGIRVAPTEPNSCFFAYSLAWAGSSLYVGGNLSSSPVREDSYEVPTFNSVPAYPLEAVYYRNGIKTVLPRGSYYGAMVNSILVVER